MRACHAVELAYVFGNTEDTIYTGKPASRALSRQIQDMWAAFALTGDPSIPGHKWPRYTREKRLTMIVDRQSHVESDVLREQRETLEPLTEYFINASYATLDLNVPFLRRLIRRFALVLLALLGLILFLVFK